MHIGFDSEYYDEQYEPKDGNRASYRNVILSYQLFLYCEGRFCYEIIYPNGKEYKHRLSLKKLLSKIIIKAKKKGIIDAQPSLINLYAHFFRADLPTCKDFFNIRDEVASVGGTVATVFKKYKLSSEELELNKSFRAPPLVLADERRHLYMTKVRFIDTMLHTPGRSGLAVAAKMIGLSKQKITDGFSMERMDIFLLENKVEFEKYALWDAIIACLFGLYMHMFSRFVLGLNDLPATLGGSSIAAFKKSLKDTIDENPKLESFERVFGFYYERQEYWHKEKNRIKTRQVKRLHSHRQNHCDFVRRTYLGGKNEGFYTGPTKEGTFLDLDLRGAYTTGLCDIHPIDYDNIYTSTNVADYLKHVAGYVHVKFEFPENVRFPCLPVSVEEKGLIFPRKGESYCTSHEILAAYNLGCKMTIIHGVIAPWLDESVHLFKPFVKRVRLERNKAIENGDEARDALEKELGNSLYGKLAQGLKIRTGFDTSTGLSRQIPQSSVTNEFFASYVTGFIRAVLAELLNSIPADKTVVSVTTDGFLSNARIEDLNMQQPLCLRYQAHCDAIDQKCMLVEKSRVRQIIGMKTRGQLTAIPFEDKPPILAKAGITPKVDLNNNDTKLDIKLKHNEEMVRMYLNRRFDDPPVDYSSFISLREQWHLEADLVRMHRARRANMEYDFKRQPVNPEMVSVRGLKHLSFDSKPWETVTDFKKCRTIFDGFRRKANLKTMEDWENWQDYYQTKLITTGIGMNLNSKGSVDILRRVFLRAYSRECWGLSKDKSYSELADWLTQIGYETCRDELKNAKRAKLVPNIVPNTPKVLTLLKLLFAEYPDLDISNLFKPSVLDDVYSALRN